MHFSEVKVMVTSRRKRSSDQAPNGINGGGVAGPFMPAWCLICAALSARLSPAPPTKSLDLSLTLTNNVIHVNDVPEHLLTMYPVCTLLRVRAGTYENLGSPQPRTRRSAVPTTYDPGRAGARSLPCTGAHPCGGSYRQIG